MTYQQILNNLKTGQLETAIAQLDTLLQTQANHAELWQAKAVALLGLHRYGLATSAAEQALQLKPTLASAHRSLGRALTELGQPYRAIAAYKQAARYYLDQRNKHNAQDCLLSIKQLQSTLERPARTAQSEIIAPPVDLLTQAKAQSNQGQHHAASETLNWLLALTPNHPQALSQRALVNIHCHAPQLATSDMAQAVALAPNDLNIRQQQGEMQLLLRDFGGAIATFTAVLQQQPDTPTAYLLRAQAHEQIGQVEAACEDVANALAVDGQNLKAYRLRGKLCETTGELKDAISNYRKAASLSLEQGDWVTHQTLQHQIQSLKSQLQTQQDAAAQTVHVPIKHLSGGTPVVEVIFNGLPFDMVLDTGASTTQITTRMADLLNIAPTGQGYFCMADGRIVQRSIGHIHSVKLGHTQMSQLRVSISPTSDEGLLGQNFLWHYDVKISRTEIELYQR